ncbi:RNA polymerase subunit sigma-24 [Methylomonas sp. Kb3]|uniref:RNA polymerase sigma factor n=1 Tax=Methylomonas sp. Kb3 TaxID=1611544 RepID=UPI000C341CCD|nr:sigma-70 family RNA polymerase sigma factor [Methylomonas sp. Kb3]PKD41001.1 RNA polymerase subunit sigma-24 [Methylomonas sp. Kb3]
MNTLLDKLFRRHGKELLAFAERQSNVTIAEDITQEAFLRLMQHPNLPAIENHRAYLFKTAANLSKNAYDHEQVRLRYTPDELVELEQLVCQLPAPETTVAIQQQLERFLSVLLQLPEVVQHAFILSKLDGLSYPDVAEALGISSKSAQRYVLKAWQHLIQHLGHDFLGDNLTR